MTVVLRSLRAIVRHMTPAMGDTAPSEVLRACIGTGLAIALTDFLLWSLRHSTPLLPGGTGNPLSEVILVSPFAATAFLILTVPNSPLAQPWSVVAGNTLGAACGVFCIWLMPYPIVTAAAAVALSVIVMALLRALHPPGAAMALNAVLLHFSGATTDTIFVLATITAGSVVLVLFGMVFNALTGRRYPFRQQDEVAAEVAPTLAAILERLKLSANIGVADLSRLMETVEAEATAHHIGSMTAASMMSLRPYHLDPTDDLPAVRSAFGDHRFHAIPVTDQGRYVGLIKQERLIDADPKVTAADLAEAVVAVPVGQELPEILTRMTKRGERTIPVVDGDQLVGVITRSDLIGVLVRALGNKDNPVS